MVARSSLTRGATRALRANRSRYSVREEEEVAVPATGEGRSAGAEGRAGAPAAAGVRRHGDASCPDPAGSEAVATPSALPATARSVVPAAPAAPIALPGPRAGGPSGVADRAATPFKLLVIESDVSDAQLIEELVAASGTPVELFWAHGLEQAAAQLAAPATGRRGRNRPADFNCVLLDLAAPHPARPGGSEPVPDPLDGLRDLLRRAPRTAVVVLTDAADAQLGAAAVAAGAQDFLIKNETDGPLLARALRYAVERKRADESQRRLVEAELRGQENARLQRHLLPTPLLDGADLSFTRRYRPGRRRALLGGDFYDAVRTDDGTVHVVIGDVCGHGPDEAALGVALRIAWRTLVFAGLTGQALLTTLQHVLEHERRSDEIFATLCMLVIAPSETPDRTTATHGRATGDGRRGNGAGEAAGAGASAAPAPPSLSVVPQLPAGPAVGPVSAGRVSAVAKLSAVPQPPAARGPELAELYLAGHPAPLLLSPNERPAVLPAEETGPALGLLSCDDPGASWPPYRLELPPGWSLLLYTDGLIEGRIGAGSRRLGQDGLVGLIGDHQSHGLSRGRLVDSAIAEVEELNGGALTDDVAVLLLERNRLPLLMG